jgi:hypothetical protein
MALERGLTRISTNGDKDKCEALKMEGMKLMGKVREQIRLSPLGLQQYKMVQKLDDGSILEATTCWGREQINIFSPVVSVETEFKLSEDFFPAYKVSDGWVIADWNLNPIKFVTDQQVIECPRAPGIQNIITTYVGSPLDAQYYWTGSYPLPYTLDFDVSATYGTSIQNSVTSEVVQTGTNTDTAHQSHAITEGGTGWTSSWGGVFSASPAIIGSGYSFAAVGDPNSPGTIWNNIVISQLSTISHTFSGNEVGESALGQYMDNTVEHNTTSTSDIVFYNAVAYDPVTGSGVREGIVSETMGPVVIANVNTDQGIYESLSASNVLMLKIIKQQYTPSGARRYPDKYVYPQPSAACVTRKVMYADTNIVDDNVNNIHTYTINYTYEERYMLMHGGSRLNRKIVKAFPRQASDAFTILGHESLTYLSVVYFEHSDPPVAPPPPLL